jgi:hypothetical protein
MRSILKFLRSLLVVVSLLIATSGLLSSPALALTQITLTDLDYRECPPEIGEGTVTSGGRDLAANCFLIFGKATNKSGKPVIDADVYGWIYDANNNSVMENRSRLGSISEIPPGTSDFELRVSIPASMPTPLSLEKFKASGFSAKVR